MTLLPPELLLLIPALAAAMAASTIIVRRLFPVYPALVSYLIFEAIQDTVLMTALRSPRRYFLFWSIFQTIGCVLVMLVARELLGLLWKRHTGIATMSRRFYLSALLVAVCIAVGVVWFAYDLPGTIGAPHGRAYFQARYVLYLNMSFTVILIGTALFMAAAGALLLWFALRLPKPVARHFYIFLFYTWAGFTGLILHRVSKLIAEGTLLNQLFLLVATVGACASWTLLLRESDAPLVQMRRPAPVREQELHAQVERANHFMLHLLRRTAYGNRRN